MNDSRSEIEVVMSVKKVGLDCMSADRRESLAGKCTVFEKALIAVADGIAQSWECTTSAIQRAGIFIMTSDRFNARPFMRVSVIFVLWKKFVIVAGCQN